MRKSILIVWFIISGYPCISQKVQDSVALKTDTAQVLNTRTFGDPLSGKYQGEEFNYDIKTGEAQNLLQQLLSWFFTTLQENFGIAIPAEVLQLLEYLIYVMMGILVIYLLVRFFVGESVSSIFNKPVSPLSHVNISEEHIENVDLEELLNAAIIQRNYRLAIRYQYLMTLKLLSQNNMIDWHYEKTNWDYQKEISAPSIQAVFKEVSFLYDYIWYGEQHISAIKYQAAEMRFAALKNQMPQNLG